MFKNFLIASLLISTVALNSCKKKDDDTGPLNQAPTGKVEDAGWVASYLKVKVTYADTDGTVSTVQLFVYKDGSLYSTGYPLQMGKASGDITFSNVIYLGTSGKYEIYADITDNGGKTTRTAVLKENVIGS